MPTTYYLRFTDQSGDILTGDDGHSEWFALSDFDYSSLQTLNIGSQSAGAGAGKVTFNPLSFTLGPNAGTTALDQAMASGSFFKRVELVGYKEAAGQAPVKVSTDVFKLAAVASDTIDVVTGAHSLTMEYGGHVESDTKYDAAGLVTNTTTAGWNRVQNAPDSDLTSYIDGGGQDLGLDLYPAGATKPTTPIVAALGDTSHDVYMRLIDHTGQSL